MNGLGRSEVQAMQREGWRFPDSGVRVGNGWLVMALDPRGDFSPQLLADPDDEPEKWSDDRDGGARDKRRQESGEGPHEDGGQLSLL